MVTASGSILVAGAINTDLVATMKRAPQAGETVTGTSFATHGGGKAANQAVAVARSGERASLVGAVGNDDFGRDRLSDLTRDGIETEWVMVNGRDPSGVALILVEDGGENRIACVPGATLAVPPDHVEAAVAALRPTFVLATNELPHDTLIALFSAARRARIHVVFNATPDPEIARDLIENVSTLIVNEGEAAVLLGREATGNPRDAVTSLCKLGPETVVLTLGSQGVIVGSADGVAGYQPPKLTVVDTTGAGDTFCGAFTAELARGTRMNDAVRYAVRASALSVTRPGAQSSIPMRDEVLAMSLMPDGSASP